jgi:hypothetical protein
MGRLKVVGTEEFMGLETHIERSSRKGASVDQNGDRSILGLWKVRLGLADTGIADGTARVDALGFVQCAIGQYYLAGNSDGTVDGAEVPTPDWT